MLTDRAEARRAHLVTVLTALSGSVDAIGFVALGGAFTSVMTGNIVLTGVSLAQAEWPLLWRGLAAITAFVVGCAIGARLAGPAGDGALWPPSVTRILMVELILLVAFGVGWWMYRSDPIGAAQIALLVGNAAALGLQSAAVQRFGVPGLSTTYLTGTLTNYVTRLATRTPLGPSRVSGRQLIALVTGGAVGAALVRWAGPVAPALPLALLVLVLVVGRTLHPGPAIRKPRIRRAEPPTLP